MVDAPVLQKAVASGSVLRPGETISAMKAAFRAEKAGALVRLAKDVGRVGEKAGIKAAQDTLKIAESPKEVARAAQLAGAKGGKTRAYPESAWPRRLARRDRRCGRLRAGCSASRWRCSAFLSSIKATTERLTYAWLRRKKARRAASSRLRNNGALALAPSAG